MLRFIKPLEKNHALFCFGEAIIQVELQINLKGESFLKPIAVLVSKHLKKQVFVLCSELKKIHVKEKVIIKCI